MGLMPSLSHWCGGLGRPHKQMYRERVEALQEFQSEVRARKFPYKAQAIFMHEGELEKLLEALDKL
ncbi:hypothetical protein [Leisingera sp. MMG026]|uniref:hypothetical protein n=1 Tax=Leisingera sp. MMG026 TaxID=2909982 RepID=UPI001F293E4D|nr:hypothetical protein [Leisingera sp. MMG026]MCF6429830.1 hypothetical protein [Leisingera sp. MMG026]